MRNLWAAGSRVALGLAIGLVAGCTHTAAARRDGQADVLSLVPAGKPRHLVYEGDNASLAIDALQRFLDGLRSEKVARLGPERAQIDVQTYASSIVDLLWQVDGQQQKKTLRIVALPKDPCFPDDPASDVADAIERWCSINGASACGRETGTVTRVRVRMPDGPLKMPIGDAAIREFRARGLDLVQEDIAQGVICLLARGADKRVLWSVVWAEDHSEEGGTWAVRHHEDPFDTKGEHEVLVGIFRRATGLEPKFLDDPR